MLEIILAAVCIFLVFCSPSLDPAIRWKERNEKKRGRR